MAKKRIKSSMSIDIDSVRKTHKPEDHGIPATYQHWHGDSCEDFVGPFFFRMEGEIACTAFHLQEHNCNAHNIVHGGMLMTFADYTLCMAALGGSNDSVVTVTCNNEFIGPAFAGDLVLGRGEVTRKGGSLIFTRVTLEANGKTILTASGVVKRLRPPQ
jgi:uncharacterized protein (TIGR00369 family)